MRDEGSPVEACSQPKCMSSLTHMSWDIKIQSVLQKLENRRQKDVMKSDSCKNRKDTAGEPIDIEWHVCLGELSVQILKKSCKDSCRRSRTHWKALRTRSSSRACSTTSPNGEVRRCKIHVQLMRKKWLLTKQDSDPVIGVSVVQDLKTPEHVTENDQFADD